MIHFSLCLCVGAFRDGFGFCAVSFSGGVSHCCVIRIVSENDGGGGAEQVWDGRLGSCNEPVSGIVRLCVFKSAQIEAKVTLGLGSIDRG